MLPIELNSSKNNIDILRNAALKKVYYRPDLTRLGTPDKSNYITHLEKFVKIYWDRFYRVRLTEEAALYVTDDDKIDIDYKRPVVYLEYKPREKRNRGEPLPAPSEYIYLASEFDYEYCTWDVGIAFDWMIFQFSLLKDYYNLKDNIKVFKTGKPKRKVKPRNISIAK